MTISKERFDALLARAKATIAKQQAEALEAMQVMIEDKQVNDVSFEGTGISDAKLASGDDTTIASAVEIIKDIASNIGSSSKQHSHEETGAKVIGVARDDIILNEKQQYFHDQVIAGKDLVLIGAAGTGKTTSIRKTTRSLIDLERLPKLTTSTKWLRVGVPGAAIISYTRKAVNNIRHAVIDELKPHVVTVHKLLEFAPIFYEIEDANSGKMKTTMRFEPSRNENNPLPSELILLIHEEASMESVDLYATLEAAMPHAHQEVFLGDIQQLPPIFGAAILGFKMLALDVIELTEIYRQAANSPIINLAWAILQGDANRFSSVTKSFKKFHPILKKEVTRIAVPSLAEFEADNEYGKLVFQPWQKSLKEDTAMATIVKQFCTWDKEGYYNSEEDIILTPFNKAFGTIELNKGIMQYLGVKRSATVYEVIAGFNKHYLAIGDRILYDKEDAFIVGIRRNPIYFGAAPMPATTYLDRWGGYRSIDNEEMQKAETEEAAFQLEAMEEMLNSAAQSVDDRVNAASHIVTVRFSTSDDTLDLNDAAQINALLGGYAITVHKAQGCEWDNVFFVLHQSQAMMIQRELLYTAVTRAKRFLHIICETNSFYKGVRSQKIKGNTLQEKADEFKGKLESNAGNGDAYQDLVHKNGGDFDVFKYSSVNAKGRNEVRYEDENIPTEVATDAETSTSQIAEKEVAQTPANDGQAAVSQYQDTPAEDIIAKAKARLAEIKAKRGLR